MERGRETGSSKGCIRASKARPWYESLPGGPLLPCLSQEPWPSDHSGRQDERPLAVTALLGCCRGSAEEEEDTLAENTAATVLKCPLLNFVSHEPRIQTCSPHTGGTMGGVTQPQAVGRGDGTALAVTLSTALGW